MFGVCSPGCLTSSALRCTLCMVSASILSLTATKGLGAVIQSCACQSRLDSNSDPLAAAAAAVAAAAAGKAPVLVQASAADMESCAEKVSRPRER